jgi:hypothetical protein
MTIPVYWRYHLCSGVCSGASVSFTLTVVHTVDFVTLHLGVAKLLGWPQMIYLINVFESPKEN